MPKFTVSASSQTGMVREHNEDAVLVSCRLFRDNNVNTGVFLSPDERYVVAVCDGLGGQNAGEVASMDAAEQLSKRVDTMGSGLSVEQVKRMMEEWVKEEHSYLLESGLYDASMEGMGTTMVGMLFYEGRYCWMNCGDSRIYRFRNGILSQVSTDHSLFQLTHKIEDAHVIVNCLGGGARDVYLDFVDFTDEVREGDVLLLCSDGLTDMLPDDRIESLLQSGADATALADAAVQQGGVDNVSVCLVSIQSL